jgi:hypothetical protein
VFAKLKGSTALSALVTGVYDEVPEGAVLPYVSIGSITETADDAHDHQGLDTLIVVHVWSDYPGNAEAADIFAAVDAALDRVPLIVAGFKDVSIKHDQHQFVKDSDPRIRHVNAQYRVWLTKTT